MSDELKEETVEQDQDFIEDEDLDDMTEEEAIAKLDEILGENDSIVEQDYLSSLVQQEDRLVYYEVENIYQNAKKRTYKSKLKLRRHPPTLTVRDDLGNEAIFYLTENLTDELIETLKDVKKAYLGFSGPSKMGVPDKFTDKILYYMKENPIKTLFPVVAIIAIIVMYLS